MNDPGHEEEIATAADETNHKLGVLDSDKRKDDENVDEQQEQALNSSAKWWYASTAFPLLAGMSRLHIQDCSYLEISFQPPSF